MEPPPEVKQIMEQHAPHFSVTADGKVKCELNGHTFPARVDALNAFVNGKKYAKLAKQAQLAAGLEKYEPFIVPSKNVPGMLFCALTGELLNARIEEVKQHMKGKKFGRARDRFQQDRQELLEEPDMQDGSYMEEDGPEGIDGPGLWIPEEVLQEYEMGEAEEDGVEGEDNEDEKEPGAAAAGEEGGAPVPAAAESGEGEGPATGSRKKGRSKHPGAGKQQQNRAAGSGGSSKKAAAGGNLAGSTAPLGVNAKQTQQKAAGGKGKQQQKTGGGGAADGGAAGGSSGKAKAPKAKKARTG